MCYTTCLKLRTSCPPIKITKMAQQTRKRGRGGVKIGIERYINKTEYFERFARPEFIRPRWPRVVSATIKSNSYPELGNKPGLFVRITNMYCVLNIGFKRCPTSREISARTCAIQYVRHVTVCDLTRRVGSDKKKITTTIIKIIDWQWKKKKKTYITQHIARDYYYYYYNPALRFPRWKLSGRHRRTPHTRRTFARWSTVVWYAQQ